MDKPRVVLFAAGGLGKPRCTSASQGAFERPVKVVLYGRSAQARIGKPARGRARGTMGAAVTQRDVRSDRVSPAFAVAEASSSAYSVRIKPGNDQHDGICHYRWMSLGQIADT